MIRYGKSMLAVAAMSLCGAVAIAPANAPAAESGYELAAKRRQVIRSGATPVRRFRSKGKQAHPKKRRNMNHVSKRVRRAHRRKRAA